MAVIVIELILLHGKHDEALRAWWAVNNNILTPNDLVKVNIWRGISFWNKWRFIRLIGIITHKSNSERLCFVHRNVI